MILIVTRRDDLTADFVIQRLIERDQAYLRFDVDCYLRDVDLRAKFSNGGIVGEVITPQGQAELATIQAIWYRRAMVPDLQHLDLSPADRRFARQEATHFLQGTIGSLPAKWVNPWEKVTYWERKLGQLRLAVSCGLTIPDTVVSSDVQQLQEFAGRRASIGKTLSWGIVPTDDGFESVYTHAVKIGDLQNQTQSQLCPTLLQERINKTGDVRLTVIGSRFYAAYLKSDTVDGIDWRRPGTPVRYSEICVPAPIADGVGQFMRRAQLIYGAFDFAVTEDGRWYFLEVNPAGEFAWLEHELKWNLRDALIDELLDLEG